MSDAFGPPVVQGDTTLVPVTRPGGRPLGAYRVTADGRVSWHPAVDVNLIVAGGQLALVAVVAIGVLGARLLQRRARRPVRRPGATW
ncbi:MAG: hypothetical protein ACT4RN_11175 [Pseudonocardia sp.]